MTEDITKCSVDELKSLLSKHKLKASGTKYELVHRLLPFQKDNGLLEKHVKEINKSFKFKTSMDKTIKPPHSGEWTADSSFYPKVTAETISHYVSFKRQGRKAKRMLFSRKIKTVKVIKVEDNSTSVFVKALVVKSFRQEVTRPATILFENNVPIKGYCTCAIGKCGICCHIIALLMYLNHLDEHKVKLLTLTGPQKMQTWHKKGNLSPRKATSTSHIPLKNFRNMRSSRRSLGGKRKTKKKDVNVPANGDDLKSDWLKRDVNQVENDIKNGIDGQNLHSHFFKTLTKFSIVSGLSMQLRYNNAFKLRAVLEDHSYCMKSEACDQAVLRPRVPVMSSDVWHSKLVIDDEKLTEQKDASQLKESHTHEKSDLMFVNGKKAMKELLEIVHSAKGEPKTLSIPKYTNKPEPYGCNYVKVDQGSSGWHSLRVGVISASKLPYLLGFHGQKEFIRSWFFIQNNIDESLAAPKKIMNFARGHQFEGKEIELFEELSGLFSNISGLIESRGIFQIANSCVNSN